jgi:hypothetical protein
MVMHGLFVSSAAILRIVAGDPKPRKPSVSLRMPIELGEVRLREVRKCRHPFKRVATATI